MVEYVVIDFLSKWEYVSNIITGEHQLFCLIIMYVSQLIRINVKDNALKIHQRRCNQFRK